MARSTPLHRRDRWSSDGTRSRGGGLPVPPSRVRSPPARFSATTTDTDRARELLTSLGYSAIHPRLHGPARRFVLDLSSIEIGGTDAGLGPVGIDRIYYGGLLVVGYEPGEDSVVVGQLTSGGYELGDGRRARRLTSGDAFLLAPGHTHHIRSSDKAERLVRIALSTLGRVAADVIGTAPGGLRFHRAEPVSPAMAGHWGGTLRRVASQLLLAPNGLVEHPLVRVQAIHALALAALAAFPNTALDLLADPHRRSSGRAGPAALRRAMALLDAHAHEPVSMEEIAERAGVGVRALQAAFRRHREQTPTAYLRQVRLSHAHRDLLLADPADGTTVAAVAARWGFGHPGRFAVAYRAVYGVPPGHTLHR